MKIYKHKQFHQWLKDELLTDNDLKNAIAEIENGLHDGDLGAGLFKKRIAMQGQGKSGSYRTLLAFKSGQKGFFIYGFSKNVKANINRKEKTVYKKLAKILLNLDEIILAEMIKNRSLIEVK